jgi:hypothetical protein
MSKAQAAGKPSTVPKSKTKREQQTRVYLVAKPESLRQRRQAL